MKELTQIQAAVIRALEQAGMAAMAAFPAQKAKAYPGAAAAVSVDTAEGRAMGFCNYLGSVFDERTGTVHERYGKQLEAVIAVDIRADRASDCQSGCETAAEVLLGGALPSGIRTGELSWESMAWERQTGMFLRRGKLRCSAVFQAETGGEGAAFLDFILKGVMKN